MNSRDPVFLDANVVIEGTARKEHDELRENAIGGRLVLVWSPEVYAEQTKRSLETPAGAERDALSVLEESERRYWEPASLQLADCTFTGLISLAQGGVHLAIQADIKGELKLLDELLVQYRVKRWDALHLMTAHSAGIPRLLTWDEEFIRKARAVPWSATTVLTPSEFLLSI